MKLLNEKERSFLLRYLDNVFIDNPIIIYGLITKYSRISSKVFYRFFIVNDGKIEDITIKVHNITEYPIRDVNGNNWVIHTHISNGQDIVNMIAEKLKYPIEFVRL